MAKRLTLEKRIRLETLLQLPFGGGFAPLKMSKKLPKIAEILEVSPSTIHREVKGKGFTYENYSANKAQDKSEQKIAEGNAHYKFSQQQKDLILATFSEFSLGKNWSPNALLLRLKSELPIGSDFPSLETIYQWIYENSQAGGKLYKLLPRQHKRRKAKVNYREQKVADKISIHLREEVADNRSRCGDIEIDSVVGPLNKAGIVTVTDRKSRFNMAGLVASKSSDDAFKTLLELLLKHKKRIKTITSDNGTEFAKHKEIASSLNAAYYFADPYSSYPRGSNEHANGMIRRYFPKGTDFAMITESELQHALYLINHLPRKIHNGRTAHEVYYGINKKLIPAKQRKILAFAFRT
jgi:IS30 family transposase